MERAHWLAMPWQVRQQIDRWQQDRARSNLLAVDGLRQFTGERVYALTVTDPAIPRSEKSAV
ncbi:MAG TPA: hypothetical protein VNL16_16480 [Chloroflexota bacterium]|nr:hypothetical protein [Chloroflexota bacterium]